MIIRKCTVCLIGLVILAGVFYNVITADKKDIMHDATMVLKKVPKSCLIMK